MTRDALFSNRVGLLLWLMIASLFSACQPAERTMTNAAPESPISSPTPPIVQVTATQSPSPPTVTPQNVATAVPESKESQMDLLALKATPTRSPSATPTPDPDAILISDEPIFVGGDVRLQGWSPDGRYLAYFEYTEAELAHSPVYIRGTAHGTFIFYDTVTGQKCQRYLLDGRFPYEGPEHGFRFTWLPNGDLLIFTEDGQAIQADAPCGQEENLTALFPEPIQSIGFFLDEKLRLLTGATAYWLYNIENRTIYPITEITPDLFNNLVMSPGGTYIGVTLAGDYTGERSPIGGTRVVDVATGQIVARYDWEPDNALDGTFGGPVWLNENEMVITVSRDQGPFFMTVDGEVRPLLPLFGLEFERGQQMPRADVYIEPDAGRYHILLTDMRWGEERLLPRIYHEDTGTVEMLDWDWDDEVYLAPEGLLVAQRDGVKWIRPVTAVAEPWQQQPGPPPVWCTPAEPSYAHSPAIGRVDIYAGPDCQLQLKLQLAWSAEGVSYLNAGISPDGLWLVLTPVAEYGRNLALFLIPLPELERINPS